MVRTILRGVTVFGEGAEAAADGTAGDPARMSGPHTRTTVRRDHAVIAPDTHVAGPVPGWSGAEHVLLIAPADGRALHHGAGRDGPRGGRRPPAARRRALRSTCSRAS